MRKYLVGIAASAAVLLGAMAIPAAAGAHVQRHAVPSKYGFLAHVKHVSINSLRGNERKTALAVGREIRARRANSGTAHTASAPHQYYIGSYYGYLDYNYWEDDLYYDGYYTYGFYYNFDNYYDFYYTYTYWVYYPQYGIIVMYGY